MSEPSQIPTESAAAARSSIVVGYSSKAEGRAALKRAVSEANLRGSDLIVVHTSADVELEDLRAELAATGVPHEIRAAADSLDPAEELLNAAEETRRRLHRDRAPAPVAGRQVAARQQRPAGPAGCGLPGAGRQG